MRRLLIMVLLVAGSVGMMAIPAKKGVYKNLTLADGKEVRAMLVGDEHGHFWRDDDGNAYVRMGDVYQPIDAEAALERARARRVQVNSIHSQRLARRVDNGGYNEFYGKRKCLIILVNFADTKFQEGHDLALYQRIANEEGFHEGRFKGSVADYFKAQSRGLFEIEFDVVGPVELSRPVAYYGQNGSGNMDSLLTVAPFEAVNLVKEMDIDWSPYDWDNNGEVDQVYFIYAGGAESDTGIEDLPWPHAYFIGKKENTPPVEVAPGLVFNRYACGTELQMGKDIAGIGTICHEFSHCLGYSDLYDTHNIGQGMGNWDLMHAGNYNDNEFCPAGYSSFERMMAGWMKPILLERGDVSVENMKSLQSGGESYIIYNKGNRNEFFMLENRQHDGWDAALPSAGLLIIHVDYDPYAWFYNEPNADPDHQRFTIVPADGQYDSYQEDGHVVYHYGNSLTDPFPQDGVTSFNKRFKTYDPQAEKAARLYHANADGNYWIDSSVEDIVQHADSTISFNFVAKDQKPNAGYEDFHGEIYSELYPLNGTDIHPTGWLEELMKRQHDGLTGHPEALSYPYNTCLWAGEISRPDEGYGENWWRYEQTAYYTDGLLRLGYEMYDDEMVAKAMEGIEYTLAHPDEDGVLGNSALVGITWPMSVFFRALQAKYEHDGDERIPAALEKHYLNFTADDLAGGIVGGRNIMSLEGILWTYGKTGNPKLLQLAEEAWARQDCFAVDATAITSNEPFYMHSVTFCEMLKLPILLYAYTYDEYYYNLAMMAIQKVERESILPDGVPSSAEFLLGDDIDISHETCNVVDYTWTLSQYLSVIGDPQWADKMEKAVYNAGLGSITKDFRSLQYFSSVNQFIATGTSNHNIYKHGSTWMAYRPTHETECCSGNVNRMLPNFVSRMWMEDRHGRAVATLYGPSKATFHTDKGDLTIACETDYPFGETLTFTVSGAEGASIPLVLRIPSWCNNASMMFHDIDCPSLPAGFFIELDPMKSGDVITLTLPMTVEKKVIEGQGVCFQRGPLLFSYAIPQQMTEDTTEYECMHGKKSENPDFKCWNITPTGDFNYAYADDGQEVQLVTMPQQAGSFPYDLDDTPVKLRIPVKQIEWNLLDDRYTPELPEQGHLKLLSDETKYIDLVPYGCTELRLTVFPDANACPLPEPEKPDYSRPADAPDCVQELDGVYCAYFEEPRFCWDEPIYCKVRTADDQTTDLQSNVDGDLCEIVGKTAIGRYIWRWTGPAVREAAPVELIFTNHDLLTHVMPFENGGYYNYDRMLYLAGQTTPTGIDEVVDRGERTFDGSAGAIYDLQGRKVADGPKRKGVYISKGKKIIR